MEGVEFIVGIDGAGLFKDGNQYLIIIDDVVVEIAAERAAILKGRLEGVYDPIEMRGCLREAALLGARNGITAL